LSGYFTQRLRFGRYVTVPTLMPTTATACTELASRVDREEMETTITFNRHLGMAECCTADPRHRSAVEACRRWRVAVLNACADGKPRTWQRTVPWRLAVGFRRHTGMPRKCEQRAPGNELVQA
jgi:hypothetical protein